MLSFFLPFFVGHQEDITKLVFSGTSPSASTVDSTAETPWHDMYRKDKYARDRVMKSARLLLPFLSQDDKKPDTILDVGCFTFEAKKYFPRAVQYIGIDQKAFHRETRVVDLNHGFTPIPCHHALCLETLEHLVDPEDTLRAIADSLAPDGRAVISLPNEATLFHRIRSLFGTVDAGCFDPEGKHLHLPNLKQSRAFLERVFQIDREYYYISPTACGSRSAWVGRILEIIPEWLHQRLADTFPSLFARGFIFLLKHRTSEQPGLLAPQAT